MVALSKRQTKVTPLGNTFGFLHPFRKRAINFFFVRNVGHMEVHFRIFVVVSIKWISAEVNVRNSSEFREGK